MVFFPACLTAPNSVALRRTRSFIETKTYIRSKWPVKQIRMAEHLLTRGEIQNVDLSVNFGRDSMLADASPRGFASDRSVLFP
jgi:hypothetical protein